MRNILVILPILGLTWVFGVVAVNSDLVAFQFIFAIANALQVLHFVDDVKCILVTRVCVSVCLSLAAFPHYCTDPDVS